MTATDVPGWIVRRRQIEGRRGERCRVCGHRRTIQTEAGPHCTKHADELPPPIQLERFTSCDRDDQDDQEHDQ